jgi:hypothetical protein
LQGVYNPISSNSSKFPWILTGPGEEGRKENMEPHTWLILFIIFLIQFYAILVCWIRERNKKL